MRNIYLHAHIQRGGGRRWGGGGEVVWTPHLKNKKIYRASKKYWSRNHKTQSYQANIQSWAIIKSPANRHLDDVSCCVSC